MSAEYATEIARDWQRESDIADDEHATGQATEEIEDRRADLILSAQLDNE